MYFLIQQHHAAGVDNLTSMLVIIMSAADRAMHYLHGVRRHTLTRLCHDIVQKFHLTECMLVVVGDQLIALVAHGVYGEVVIHIVDHDGEVVETLLAFLDISCKHRFRVYGGLCETV